jgi:hypothetical protein
VSGSAAIRFSWVASVAVVLTLALAPPAQAGFSSLLVPLSGPAPAGNTGVEDTAINASGEALVAWSEGDIADIVVKLRMVMPDGNLGPTITIADDATRAFSPEVAFAPNGRAIVAWLEDESFSTPKSVRARWIEPDGTLGPIIPIVNGGAAYSPGEHDVAATATNSALVAWHNFVSMPPPFRRVEARLVSPEGTASELIFPTSGGGSTGVVPAADTEGGALLSWRDSSIRAQSISSEGIPGTLETPAPGVVADPALSTDGDDHFHLLYRRTSPYSIEYKSLGADGSSGPEQILEPLSPVQVGSSYDVATNPANRSLAAWSREEGSVYLVKARYIDGAGTPADETFVAPTGVPNVPSINAALGSESGALTLELIQEGKPDTLLGWMLPAAGPADAPILLSTPSGNPSSPHIEIGAGDVGLVAWHERIDADDPESPSQILVRQILPPPSCPDASGTIVQGRPTRIDLRCTGLQLGAPEIVAPPAHGSLGAPDAASQSVVYTPTPGYDGVDSFTFRGTNPGGPGTTRTASLEVGRDTIRPVITSFRISGRRIVGKAGVSATRKGRRDTVRLRLRFSEPATATVIVVRRKRCLRSGGRVRCSKPRKLGRLRTKAAKSSVTLQLPRRMRKKLRPGRRYQARAIAADPAGNRSKVKRLSFRVARRQPPR